MTFESFRAAMDVVRLAGNRSTPTASARDSADGVPYIRLAKDQPGQIAARLKTAQQLGTQVIIIARQRRGDQRVAQRAVDVAHFAQRIFDFGVLGQVSKGVAALQKGSPHTGVGVAEGFKVDDAHRPGPGPEDVENASDGTHDAFSGRA
ncbi:hypothetical protein HG530_000364 [Fusarium avenaceum]|nr:hypothetical protein HG530_000364 [Fusarium avenaceum]